MTLRNESDMVSATASIRVNAESVARDIVVIGASAGGIEALTGLLCMLPADVPAVVAVVLHRSPFAASSLLQVLERATGRHVVEPLDGEPLERGRIFLAPRDQHILVKDGAFEVNRGPKEHFTRPAIDPLFASAAAYGPRVAGVLLSGAGDDGVLGLIRIKAAGGVSLVQTPAQATHGAMPANAIRHDRVDAILPVSQLALALASLAAGKFLELPRLAARV